MGCLGDDPAAVNVGLKIDGVGSMELMNGQSSGVNIAATASEVRTANLSYWLTMYSLFAFKCTKM